MMDIKRTTSTTISVKALSAGMAGHSGNRWLTPFRSLIVFPVAVIAAGIAHTAEADDIKFVDIFLQNHCVRCHNEKKSEGELNLDDMAIDVAANRANFAGILERLQGGDMPPEGEPRPEPADVAQVREWIQAGLTAMPAASSAEDQTAVRPSEGNHIPHALLFGGKAGPSVPPPPRLWRLSPRGYAAGLLGAVRVHARQIPQPFALRDDAGLKDYAALYWIDEGSTDILMRNAEKIVEMLTNHNLRTPKGGGPVRVGLRPRRWKDERFRPPKEFEPLLHPEVGPDREQLEAAISVDQVAASRIGDQKADKEVTSRSKFSMKLNNTQKLAWEVVSNYPYTGVAKANGKAPQVQSGGAR